MNLESLIPYMLFLLIKIRRNPPPQKTSSTTSLLPHRFEMALFPPHWGGRLTGWRLRKALGEVALGAVSGWWVRVDGSWRLAGGCGGNFVRYLGMWG